MDNDADALYGLPRDEFIARRGDLAKSLRKAGRREEAATVAALRKPSVAAWAVNQLMRTQRSSVQDLFEAGDALRDAQSDLLEGKGDGRTLRSAGERERAAVEGLVDRARGLLSSAGDELSPAVIERVADTLHAAALDEDAREQVRDGRLERELRHVGLGLGPGESGVFSPEPRRPRAKEPDASTQEPPSEAGTADRAGAKGSAATTPAGKGPAAKNAAKGSGGKSAAKGSSGKPAAKGSGGKSAAKGSSGKPAAKGSGGKAAAKGSGGEAAAEGSAKNVAEGAPVSKRTAAKIERERAEAERAEAERLRRERAAAVKAARTAEVAARRRAAAGARTLTAAKARRDEAAQALSEAEDALAAAREDAAGADAAHRQAQAELAEAERRRRDGVA